MINSWILISHHPLPFQSGLVPTTILSDFFNGLGLGRTNIQNDKVGEFLELLEENNLIKSIFDTQKM